MGAGKNGAWSGSMVMGVLIILVLVLQMEGTIGECDKACLWRCKQEQDEDWCKSMCWCWDDVAAKPNHLRSSGEPNAVGLCTSGCRSSICGIINTVDGTQARKHAAVELCDEACARFCSKGGAFGIESVTA